MPSLQVAMSVDFPVKSWHCPHRQTLMIAAYTRQGF